MEIPQQHRASWDPASKPSDEGTYPAHTRGMSRKRNSSYKSKKLMAFFFQPQHKHPKDGAGSFSTPLTRASAERDRCNTSNRQKTTLSLPALSLGAQRNLGLK